MKYILVHLLRGEARIEHEAITKDLAEKFDVFPIHERIPPHLTLKRTFEFDDDDMASLYERLQKFTKESEPYDYVLRGFGNFVKDVIYVDVLPSAQMSERVLELMNELHTFPNMSFDQYDNGGDFHATVAFAALKPFDYGEVWNYLQTIQQPDFKMKFDNIAVLRKPDDVWEIEKVFEIE